MPITPTQTTCSKVKQCNGRNLSQAKMHANMNYFTIMQEGLYLNAQTWAGFGESRHSKHPSQRFLAIHMSNAGIPLSPGLSVSAREPQP